MILYLLCVLLPICSYAIPIQSLPSTKTSPNIVKNEVNTPPVLHKPCLKEDMAKSIKVLETLYSNCVLEKYLNGANNKVCYTLDCPQVCTDHEGTAHGRGSKWKEPNNHVCECGDASEWIYDAHDREIFGIPFPAYRACDVEGKEKNSNESDIYQQYFEPLPSVVEPVKSSITQSITPTNNAVVLPVTPYTSSEPEPPTPAHGCIAYDIALQMLASDVLYSECTAWKGEAKEDCYSITCPQECVDDKGQSRAKGDTWLEPNSTTCQCGHPASFIYNANSREIPGIPFPAYKSCRVQGEGAVINGSVPYDIDFRSTDGNSSTPESPDTVDIQVIDLGVVVIDTANKQYTANNNQYPGIPGIPSIPDPPIVEDMMCPSKQTIEDMILSESLYDTCSIYAVKGTKCYTMSCPQACRDTDGKAHFPSQRWRENGKKICKCGRPGDYIYNANSRQLPGFPFPAYKSCEIEGCKVSNRILDAGERIKHVDNQTCECRENVKWIKQLKNRPDLLLQDSPLSYHLYCHLPGCRHPLTMDFLSPGSRFTMTSKMTENRKKTTKTCTCNLVSENPWESYEKEPYTVACEKKDE